MTATVQRESKTLNKKTAKTKMAKLKIHPAPFKSSRLSIPPSPFSPRIPITPLYCPPKRSLITHPPVTISSIPPPPSPLQWLWQCHQCQRTYALGVTRRCFDDGHHFCAGTTTVKNWRKAVNPRHVRRHRACASEFDYQGWKAWGKWRREEAELYSLFDGSSSSSSSGSSSSEWETDTSSRSPTPRKDCWNKCDYPSECRWGRQFGVHSPAVTEPQVSVPAIPVGPPTQPAPSGPCNLEGVLKAENTAAGREEKKSGKGDLWGALLASATRRKAEKGPSPLGLAPEPEEGNSDRDGDVCMMETTASSASAPVMLKSVMKKTSKKFKSALPVELKAPDPVLQVSSAAAAVGEFDLEEEDVGESASLNPLQRLKSRDSGYFSHDACEMDE